jgi:hypothetical protein
VHENKQKDGELAGENGETYTKMKRHFTQKPTILAEMRDFLITIRALGNELRTSKCGNSRRQFPAGSAPPTWRRATFKSGQHANLGEVVEPTAPPKPNCQTGSQGRAMETPLNPKMYKKPKGIAVRRENPQKCISMKSKELIAARMARLAMEKAYGK